jgi:hypothetical protein
MVDTELIAQELRDRGHKVEHITRLSENSGTWEFEVDGRMLTLEEARALLETES